MTMAQNRAKAMEVFEYREAHTAEYETPTEQPPAEPPTPDAADDIASLLQRAHDEGARQARQKARDEYERTLAEERNRIAAALHGFEKDVAEYYSRIEVEVVKLSLAIASKVLHREAQVDSLLVAALARVALDKFYKNTKAVIRVRPEETSGWRQFFAQHMEQSSMPEIVEDSSIQAHNCVLETDLGSTELGIETQLKEIENGLFDLLAQRPQPQ